jgi:hypothetical protein
MPCAISKELVAALPVQGVSSFGLSPKQGGHCYRQTASTAVVRCALMASNATLAFKRGRVILSGLGHRPSFTFNATLHHLRKASLCPLRNPLRRSIYC